MVNQIPIRVGLQREQYCRHYLVRWMLYWLLDSENQCQCSGNGLVSVYKWCLTKQNVNKTHHFLLQAYISCHLQVYTNNRIWTIPDYYTVEMMNDIFVSFFLGFFFLVKDTDNLEK